MGGRRVGGWFSSYASALSRRDLRLLLGGLITSATGSWAYNVALVAFVFSRTHSLTWVGAAGLVRFLPALLLSTYGGVMAERTERVRLMVSADLLCALWQIGLAIVVAENFSVTLALVLAALTAATNVVYNPAVAATIPSVVSENDLVAANALNGTIDNLVVIVGPALGAILVLAGATAGVFAVNAASFLIYLWSLYIELRGTPDRPRILAPLLLAGGVLFVALHAVSDIGITGLVGAKLAAYGAHHDHSVSYSLYLTTYAFDSVADVFGSAFALATGLIVLQTGVLPRWLGRISIAAGLMFFLQAFGLGGVIASFGLVLDIIGFVLFLIFVFASSVIFLRRPTAASNTAAAEIS